MSADLLEMLVVPICFVMAGLLGLRLGTPHSVAAGLLGVGGFHLLAFFCADRAQATTGTTADLLHVGSQMLFGLGFASLFWIAQIFPSGGRPSGATWGAGLLASAGPLLGGLAGATPSVTGGAELGPVAGVLPEGVAGGAGLPLTVLPLAAVVLFAVRLVRADGETRRMMWWPVVGVGLVAGLAVSGLVLGTAYPGAADVIFLVAAPVVPLSVAFGPVRRRLVALTDETARLNADLAERVAELEASRRRLAAASEVERRRIERDLHDGAQQELLALITHTEIATSATDDEQREAALARVAQLGRAAYETVRAVSHGVRPAVLDDLGLAAAIRGLAEDLPLDMRVDLAITPPGAFAPETEGAALFFMSEALANVLRHGQATAVWVLLTTGDDGLRVQVADDGVGGADPLGTGIRGLRDRVGAAGGTLTLASGSGGTRITATFPLPPQEAP